MNLLEKTDTDQRHLVVSGLISVFQKIFSEYWTHRQEHILRNTILALLDYPKETTLLDVHTMINDWRYRKEIVSNIQDPIVQSFWKHEFPKYVYQSKGEALTPIQNKLGAFLSTPLIRNIIAQPETKIDFRKVIDNQKILIVNLSKGRIGADNSALLGSLIVTKLQLAAMSRIDIAESKRKDFYLFVDEFQNFVSFETFSEILSEARKYRLNLALAHQYISQLEEEVRKAIFGNVGTIISFRVGVEDTEVLEKEFYPKFKKEDLINLDKYRIYLKMTINGKTSEPFSARTLSWN